MRRSTVVAAVAVVWMGAVLVALDGAFSGFAVFAALVLLVGIWEIGKAVRLRRAG